MWRQKRYIISALLLTIMLLSAISFAPVAAHDNDGDGVEDEREEAEKRELRIEVQPDRVRVRSEFENASHKNRFEIEFRVDNGAEIEFRFEDESGQSSTTEADLRILVEFKELIEFNDTNSNGLFDNGTDTKIQTIDLSQRTFQLEFTSINSTDGEAGFRFIATHTQGGFLFEVTLDLFPQYALVDDTLVTPTETKLSMRIQNFPFQESTSKLALFLKAFFRTEVQVGEGSTETEIRIVGKGIIGFLNWVQEAVVDGVLVPIETSIADADEPKEVFFNYPHAASILHDPKLGLRFSSSSPQPPGFPTPLFGLPLILALTAALAILIRSRQRRVA